MRLTILALRLYNTGMYPIFYVFGLELDAYLTFVCLGIIVALVIYRLFSSRVRLGDASFIFYGIILVASICAGFFFAWFFQGIYDLIAYGKSEWDGITFMGGLLGAAVTFFALSMLFSRTKKWGGRQRWQDMWKVVCLAPLSITAAHCLGRIACFLSPCCYGKETTSAIGVEFPYNEKLGKRIPTQLFEAIFLAVLFCVLLVMVLRYKKYSLTMLIYLYSYAVFRFIIEFWRGDPRGEKGIFSPSQWQSILMFCVAIALTVYIFVLKRIPFNGKKSELTKKQLTEFLE